jgi:hypothetical protein
LLIGYENDHHPRVCAIVGPPTKDKVAAARRASEKRNTAKLAQRPDRHNIVNCFAYATDFAAGGSRIDVQQWLIDETRDSPARPVELPARR